MGLSSRQRKKRGPRGLGEIRVMKSGEVRVYLVDGEYKETYTFAPEDVEEQYGGWKFGPIKDAFIELTGDEGGIRSVRPYEGEYFFKFLRFAARPDSAPTIKHVPKEHIGPLPNGSEWDNPPHDEFYPVLSVVGEKKVVNSRIVADKKFAGTETLLSMVYQFERNPASGLMEVVWERKFWYDALDNFLQVAGYDYDADNLTPSENVLKELEAILLKRDRVFEGSIVGGYVKGLLRPAPVGVKI